MNTLTEAELTAVAASGNPVASWPASPILVPGLPVWLVVALNGERHPLSSHVADS
jgi:hypothetical protein